MSDPPPQGREEADAPERARSSQEADSRQNVGSRASRLYAAHGEKLRYLIVGGWNTALAYAVFLLALTYLGPPLKSLSDSSSAVLALLGHYYYLAIQWGVWVVMVVQSTVTMKYIAFRSPGRLGRQVVRAYGVYFPMQLLSAFLLWFTVKVLGLHPAIGQLITIAFATVFSYLGHKYFTFRQPAARLESEEWGGALEEGDRTAEERGVPAKEPAER